MTGVQTCALPISLKDARAYAHNAYKIPLGQQVIARNLRDLTAQESV